MRCKFLQIVSKLAVAEGKPKKHSVTEGRYGFSIVTIGKEGNNTGYFYLFLFVLFSLMFMSHDH